MANEGVSTDGKGAKKAECETKIVETATLNVINGNPLPPGVGELNTAILQELAPLHSTKQYDLFNGVLQCISCVNRALKENGMKDVYQLAAYDEQCQTSEGYVKRIAVLDYFVGKDAPLTAESSGDATAQAFDAFPFEECSITASWRNDSNGRLDIKTRNICKGRNRVKQVSVQDWNGFGSSCKSQSVKKTCDTEGMLSDALPIEPGKTISQVARLGPFYTKTASQGQYFNAAPCVDIVVYCDDVCYTAARDNLTACNFTFLDDVTPFVEALKDKPDAGKYRSKTWAFSKMMYCLKQAMKAERACRRGEVIFTTLPYVAASTDSVFTIVLAGGEESARRIATLKLVRRTASRVRYSPKDVRDPRAIFLFVEHYVKRVSGCKFDRLARRNADGMAVFISNASVAPLQQLRQLADTMRYWRSRHKLIEPGSLYPLLFGRFSTMENNRRLEFLGNRGSLGIVGRPQPIQDVAKWVFGGGTKRGS